MKEIKAAGDDLSAIKSKDRTLAAAIDRYTTESSKKIGKTKAQVLRSIREYDIASMPCNEIQSPDIVQFAKELSAAREPSTVGNYPSHLAAVFPLARPSPWINKR